MIYEFEDTIPSGTASTAMRRLVMTLVPGVIHKIEIDFPAGCQCLAHVTIWDGEHQRWPTNPEKSFCAEDYVISFPEYFPIATPAELELRTWNLDDTYDHTVRVRIGVLPAEMVAPYQSLDKLTQVLKTIVGASL